MKSAVIYIRVSTDEQAEGYSLRIQEDICVRFCQVNDYRVLRVFKDDYSAKTFLRPGYTELLKFIRDHKTDTLIVSRYDRFSRGELIDQLEMIRTLKKSGVQLRTVEFDLNDNNPEQKLIQTILMQISEIDNIRRAKNIKAGMRRAMLEGRWMGGAPFGYKNSRDAHSKPIIIPSEKADIARAIFKKFADGHLNINEVRRQFMTAGYNRTRNAIHALLRNPVYIGKIRVPASDNDPERIVDGIHEAILDSDTFERVQNVLSGRAKVKTRRSNEIFPLKGFLQCPRCGRTMTGDSSRGNGGLYHYYRCHRGCSEIVRADIANNKFIEYLSDFKIDKDFAEVYLLIMEDIFKEKEKFTFDQINSLNKRIKESEIRMQSLDRKFIDNEISKITYDRMRTEFENERCELTAQRQQFTDTGSNFRKYLKDACALLIDIDRRYADAPIEIKQQIIGCVFPEKIIFANGRYTTKRINAVLESMLSKNNILENKKAVNFDGMFSGVDSSDHLHNQFLNDQALFIPLLRYFRIL